MISRAIIEARLAENPRAHCQDCGCEEGCVSYLRDLLAELDAQNPRIDYLRDCLAEMAAAPVATPVAARDARSVGR